MKNPQRIWKIRTPAQEIESLALGDGLRLVTTLRSLVLFYHSGRPGIMQREWNNRLLTDWEVSAFIGVVMDDDSWGD